MIPQAFPESNAVLTKPGGWTDKQCKPLPVWRDPENPVIVSCWKATWRERLSILIFGRVWFRIIAAMTHPPIKLEGAKTIWRKK